MLGDVLLRVDPQGLLQGLLAPSTSIGAATSERTTGSVDPEPLVGLVLPKLLQHGPVVDLHEGSSARRGESSRWAVWSLPEAPLSLFDP